MEVIRNSIRKKIPDMSKYGCSANCFNLLFQDVTPAQVINQIAEISKYFTNHHLHGAALLECIKGSVKPQFQEKQVRKANLIVLRLT